MKRVLWLVIGPYTVKSHGLWLTRGRNDVTTANFTDACFWLVKKRATTRELSVRAREGFMAWILAGPVAGDTWMVLAMVRIWKFWDDCVFGINYVILLKTFQYPWNQILQTWWSIILDKVMYWHTIYHTNFKYCFSSPYNVLCYNF